MLPREAAQVAHSRPVNSWIRVCNSRPIQCEPGMTFKAPFSSFVSSRWMRSAIYFPVPNPAVGHGACRLDRRRAETVHLDPAPNSAILMPHNLLIGFRDLVKKQTADKSCTPSPTKARAMASTASLPASLPAVGTRLTKFLTPNCLSPLA